MAQPKSKTRVGVVSVTTWENEIEYEGVKKKVLSHTPEISYKDGDEWKTGKSYKTSDIPKLILALQKEYEKALLEQQ